MQTPEHSLTDVLDVHVHLRPSFPAHLGFRSTFPSWQWGHQWDVGRVKGLRVFQWCWRQHGRWHKQHGGGWHEWEANHCGKALRFWTCFVGVFVFLTNPSLPLIPKYTIKQSWFVVYLTVGEAWHSSSHVVDLVILNNNIANKFFCCVYKL